MDEMRETDSEPYLKMAIQTVLFLHRHELHLIGGENGHELLDKISAKIHHLAHQFESIAHNVMKGQEEHVSLSLHRLTD